MESRQVENANGSYLIYYEFDDEELTIEARSEED